MSASERFIDWTRQPGREVTPGDVVWDATGQDLQVIRARLTAGTDFPIHRHPQEQIIVVLAGELEFVVDGVERRVGANQVIHIPPGIPHGGRVVGLKDVETIEAFHPIRNDFRPGSRGLDLHQSA